MCYVCKDDEGDDVSVNGTMTLGQAHTTFAAESTLDSQQSTNTTTTTKP